MKKIEYYAASAAAMFGLFACIVLASGENAAREELANARAMLKQTACVLPVVKQPAPEIVIEVEKEQRPATLAEKNRNPLNVKRPGSGGRWKGQVGVDKFGHAIFESEEWGLRAGALVLRAYAKKHKISTVEALVERFAEGNRESYVKNICRRLRVEPGEKIDLVARMPELLRAMVRQESGRDLPDYMYAPYEVAAFVAQNG